MATKVARYTQDNQNPVGMIVASMLTETQFQSINGTNWVLAAGQSVAGSLYATTTGSSLAPDLRGRVMAGKDDMGGTPAYRLTNMIAGIGVDGLTLGATGGHQANSLTEVQMPGHNHGGGYHKHDIAAGGSSGMFDTNPNDGFDYRYTVLSIQDGTSGRTPAHGIGVSSANGYGVMAANANIATQGNGGTIGDGQSHNNTQPTIIVNYFIKIN